MRVMLLGLALVSTFSHASEQRFDITVPTYSGTSSDKVNVSVKPFCKFGLQFLTIVQTRSAQNSRGGIETIQVFEKSIGVPNTSVPMPCREEH